MGGSPLTFWDKLSQTGTSTAVAGTADPKDAASAPAAGSADTAADPAAGQSTAGGSLGLTTVTVSEDSQGAIYVKDVSEVVAKAQKSVVGVASESYSNFSYSSAGSGIILSKDGYIVTNNHEPLPPPPDDELSRAPICLQKNARPGVLFLFTIV